MCVAYVVGLYFVFPHTWWCKPCARCDSEIVYRVSQDTARYTCPDDKFPGATLGTPPGRRGTVLQFTGRQCGYDSWLEVLESEIQLNSERKVNT